MTAIQALSSAVTQSPVQLHPAPDEGRSNRFVLPQGRWDRLCTLSFCFLKRSMTGGGHQSRPCIQPFLAVIVEGSRRGILNLPPWGFPYSPYLYSQRGIARHQPPGKESLALVCIRPLNASPAGGPGGQPAVAGQGGKEPHAISTWLVSLQFLHKGFAISSSFTLGGFSAPYFPMGFHFCTESWPGLRYRFSRLLQERAFRSRTAFRFCCSIVFISFSRLLQSAAASYFVQLAISGSPDFQIVLRRMVPPSLISLMTVLYGVYTTADDDIGLPFPSTQQEPLQNPFHPGLNTAWRYARHPLPDTQC